MKMYAWSWKRDDCRRKSRRLWSVLEKRVCRNVLRIEDGGKMLFVEELVC
jgi:hypothetical protein